MKPNYRPPEKFHIGNGQPDITPELFDTYRHKKDDLADKIAASIYEFSKLWASEHAQMEHRHSDSAHRHEDLHKAQDHVRHSEQAFHFFSHMESAIQNPHPGDAPTRYRYKWEEDDIELADKHGSDAITLLDTYFDDDRHEENDPFAFLFTEEVQTTIERGAKIFEAYGTNVIAVLAVRSLLKQYAAFNASNVLVSTKFLTRFPHRRIFETMQFLIDIVTPGNLRKNGIGIIAIKKLRLVHALVRHRIAINDQNINQKFTSWNTRSWGEPINQQDMIFAVHTFSIEIIRGLQKVGYFLDLSEIERRREAGELHAGERLVDGGHRTIKEDYYKAWHYIGKALGVCDEINPITYEDGWRLQQYIYHTQFRLGDFDKENPDLAQYPNLTSPVLAEPLINFIVQLLPFTNRRQDALAVVAMYNDEADYDPIFKDILGLDVKGLADHDFQDFIAGALNMFDRFLEIFYKVNPTMGIGKVKYIKKIGALNRSLFIRLRKMSMDWKGSHFTIRDGLDNEAGRRQQRGKKRKKAGSIVAYIFSFMILPILFTLFKPLSNFLKKRVMANGHKNPRLNFNVDAENFAQNAAHFCVQNKEAIKNGSLVVDQDFMDAAYDYQESEITAP